MKNIIEWDYRPKHLLYRNQQQEPKTLKCIQWNIERGYHLEDIVLLLKKQKADIISLQELDVFCERSSWTDEPRMMAKALKMKCVFITEFEEIHSSLRSKRNQGGGLHGNAILSKFSFDYRILNHSWHPINWSSKGHSIGEPRIGERKILVAEFFNSFLVYNVHFEVFCGIDDRIRLFDDILRDSIKSPIKRQIIMGDLNTGAHGIARLHYLFCSDGNRFRNWGHSEASLWILKIFSIPERGNFFWDPFPLSLKTLHSHARMYEAKLDWILLRGWRVLWKDVDNYDYKLSDHRMLIVIIEPFGVKKGFWLNMALYQGGHKKMKRNTFLIIFFITIFIISFLKDYLF